VPLPSHALTTPAGDTTRTAALPTSATYILPHASSASALGALNDAAVPAPFAAPGAPPALPASVVTTPPRARRKTLLPVSATTMAPPGSTSTPPIVAEKDAVSAAPASRPEPAAPG